MSPVLNLRTRAWYGDDELRLAVPAGWNCSLNRPRTPSPLDGPAIAEALKRPVGQPRIRDLAAGKRRPVVVVDDLTRPTPADRILPPLLEELAQGGIESEQVTLVIASGTHGPPSLDAVTRKVGAEAAGTCRLHAHDDRAKTVRVGRTSFGTPVSVNPEVAASDLLIGVGGVYPQHSTGFGGGSKLAIGILARRSIMHLHYGHPSMEGSYRVDNDFRRDLDEIAHLVGLRTTVSVHIDADRRVVRAQCGDPDSYYPEAVRFSRDAYRAPTPEGADVVVSNAYPIDVSLTFMRSKGLIPLLRADPGASRVLISACPEGVGHHGLYPFVDLPRLARPRHLYRMLRVDPLSAARKGRAKLGGMMSARERPAEPPSSPSRPVLLYAPGHRPGDLPRDIPGMTLVSSWEAVLEQVAAEQGRNQLEVAVYPCAPLQVLEAEEPAAPPPLPGEAGAVA